MGIISLNEKRTGANSTHTTGKEKSYFASDQFIELLGDAKLTGKYHYHGGGRMGFGVFWESTTGALSDLTFVSNSPSFSSTERTSETHSYDWSGWSNWEIDLAGKPHGRPVFYLRLTSDSGSDYTFQSDWALDDIQLETINGTIKNFDPSNSSNRSDGIWETTDDADSNAAHYTGAKSAYDSSDLFTVPSNSNNGRWCYKAGSTTSGGTGPDNAADNNDSTYYIYFESSGSNNGSCTYLTWDNYRNLFTGAVA